MPGSYVLHRQTDTTAQGRAHCYAAGSGGVEDLALLRFELGVGEHAGVPELAELLELGQLVVRARGGGRWRVLRLGGTGAGRRCGVGCGLLFLFLGGPPSLLAVVDRVRRRRWRFRRQLRCGRPREADLAWD